MTVQIHSLKGSLMCFVGVCGGIFTQVFGGWNRAMTTLLFFMAFDYISGLLVAGVFRRSDKTPNGGLESRAGWKGLCRKGMTLCVVLVAARLDLVLGTGFFRDAAVIAYIVNETISIIENAGLMGLPVPEVLMKAVEALQDKNKEGETDVHKKM